MRLAVAAALAPAVLAATGAAQQLPVPPGAPAQEAAGPPAPAARGPAVRVPGQAIASTSEPLASVSSVRPLSDGRVLVNDGLRRRLLLFDSTLATFTVIADSAIGAANAYGTRQGTLLAYRADTSLLIDAASLSMLVIDPAGEIVRVRAVPRTQDVSYYSPLTVTYGYPGFDAEGRLIYRGQAPSALPRIPQGGGVLIPETPDSAAIRRIDLATRKVDSIAMVKVNRSSYIATQNPNGGISLRSRSNPLPMIDEWAVMADGSVAVVRGRDYHVDWVSPDGSVTSSPRIPFDWQRLDLDDKIRLMDSLRTAQEAARARTIALMQVRYDSLAAIARSSGGPMPAPPPSAAMLTGPNLVPPDELPDYRPPFGIGAVRGDADNNLWIRVNPMRPTPGAPVYDIVDRQGELIDRVQIPPPRTLVGFGPGGVVYLLARGATGARLEKVRIR